MVEVEIAFPELQRAAEQNPTRAIGLDLAKAAVCVAVETSHARAGGCVLALVKDIPGLADLIVFSRSNKFTDRTRSAITEHLHGIKDYSTRNGLLQEQTSIKDHDTKRRHAMFLIKRAKNSMQLTGHLTAESIS